MADDEGARVRTRNRFLGIQPSDVDELEPGGDETDEDRGVMKRQRRARGGHASGEHSKSRADKPRRGHHLAILLVAPAPHREHRARGGRANHRDPEIAREAREEGESYEHEAREHGLARGGRLSYAARQKLPSSEFALPGHGTGPKGKGGGSYPIPDASHARNALSRVSQHGSPSEKARVRAAVHRKFPEIGQE